MKCSLEAARRALVEEAKDVWTNMRHQRCTLGFLFAIVCVFLVIVGNVILLIGINFWLSIFPTDSLTHNSSQIAIQVVASMLMLLFFTAVSLVFVVVFGGVAVWRVLTDTNRMKSPLHRFLLLVASGVSNGLSGVLGVYSMTYTPEFVQAVLLCCIPFSAQAWTVLFIPEERQRNYMSLFFIGSFVLFIAGVLLSSMSAFLQHDSTTGHQIWAWALIYLLSSVLFGLWCVVQRLYLDGLIVQEPDQRAHADHVSSKALGVGPHNKKTEESAAVSGTAESPRAPEKDITAVTGVPDAAGRAEDEVSAPPTIAARRADAQDSSAAHSGSTPITNELQEFVAVEEREEAENFTVPRAVPPPEALDDGVAVSADEDDEDDADAESAEAAALLVAEKRFWAKQSVSDNAGKLVLLVGGLIFQLLISFVVFPVDAIPWFGTSSSAAEAWTGFSNSVNFIFRSWFNIRYGLLYTLGYIMSFIGCTFLNEHSPTLASVVLQLAGPVTSLVIIIIPQWNVYKDNGNVGHKVGGVILLLAAALLYHVWEQRSLKEMVRRAHEAEAAAAAAVDATAPDSAAEPTATGQDADEERVSMK